MVYAYALNQLSPIKRPRYIVMVDSLPHTGSMKIAKFRLKPADNLRRLATDFSSKEVQP
jgi:acyl-coenzyme A synthetase/AMP-(fatty) acid ligase